MKLTLLQQGLVQLSLSEGLHKLDLEVGDSFSHLGLLCQRPQMPMRDEPMRDEPMRDEPMRDEPMRDEPMRGEPMRDGP
jgi:hypothetical protein